MVFKKSKQDILIEKQGQLRRYIDEFDFAVSTVTDTIDRLGEISQSIDMTIREIDDYQKELGETRIGLSEAKSKNDRVIANFRALLCAD